MIGAGALHFSGPPAGDPSRTAYLVGIAAVLAGMLQVAWSLHALRGYIRSSRVFTGAWRPPRAPCSNVSCLFPSGLAGSELNTMMDTLIAMWPNSVGPTIAGTPYPLDVQANSILTPTTRLYRFPLVYLGSLSPPRCSHCSRETRMTQRLFPRPCGAVSRLSLFIGLPASVGLVMVRHDLTAVMFGGGDSGSGRRT